MSRTDHHPDDRQRVRDLERRLRAVRRRLAAAEKPPRPDRARPDWGRR